MMSFFNFVLIYFFSLSLFFCLMSYLNIDPMKSSLLLIFSLICTSPLISFGQYIWMSYFICLLFLSGIFVIIVYFSSLSKINFVGVFLGYFVFIISLFSFVFMYNFGFLSLNVFYYLEFMLVLLFSIFSLLYFMNFSSYFLNFPGALRKV